MTVTVVLADDQPLVRAGIAMLLEAEPDITVVAEADDGAQAVEAARRLRPDVVVMDVRMPVLDGIAATRTLTADAFTDRPDHPVAVLVLTTFRDDDAVVAAVQAGASGFLLKETTPTTLASAIRAVARGDGWLDPAVTGVVLHQWRSTPTVVPDLAPRLRRLTERELEVLRAMGNGLSNAEIARALVVGEATVKTHVSRVLMKLGVRDRAQAVTFAFQSGAMLPRAGGR